MLFDLRSRGRRRTVRGVYLGLAILMGGGLVLFGVGTGIGGGGLLNAFSGGSGNNQNQVVGQQETSALVATRRNPNDPGSWAALLQARWAAAQQGGNYNPSTVTFTAAGKKELAGVAQAWQRYLQLTKTPDSSLAILAARAYAGLGNYAGSASAWELQTAGSPNQAKGFECLAVFAYAAKENRKGDLATAKALNLVPKVSRSIVKQQIDQAKKQPAVAQQEC